MFQRQIFCSKYYPESYYARTFPLSIYLWKSVNSTILMIYIFIYFYNLYLCSVLISWKVIGTQIRSYKRNQLNTFPQENQAGANIDNLRGIWRHECCNMVFSCSFLVWNVFMFRVYEYFCPTWHVECGDICKIYKLYSIFFVLVWLLIIWAKIAFKAVYD